MDVDLSTENTKRNQISSTVSNQPIIPSPIKLPIDNCLDSLYTNSKPNYSSTPTKTPSKQNSIDYFSPCSNHGEKIKKRFYNIIKFINI